MLLGAGDDLARQRRAERAFLIARLAAFAERLRGLGVPGVSIRVGLHAAPMGQARLTFFDRAVEDAAVSFEGAAP